MIKILWHCQNIFFYTYYLKKQTFEAEYLNKSIVQYLMYSDLVE